MNRRTSPTLLSLATAFALTSCAVIEDIIDPPATDNEIRFEGIGEDEGIFDPSLAEDPDNDRIWMAYSEVSTSTAIQENGAISTRLAYSNDKGATWTDAGLVINPAADSTGADAPDGLSGTWVHEVSALVHDPGAPQDERWKIAWHRYLWVDGDRRFEHGWIATRTAPAPEGPWSDEVKLFTGSLYDVANDDLTGAPLVRLDELDDDLQGCLAFTEPGLLATADALYMSLSCATGGDGGVVLLRWSHPDGPWEYRGTLLDDATDGDAFGYDGFTASELVQDSGKTYLIATPRQGDNYRGCMVFEVEDLDAAALRRSEGKPDAVLTVSGSDGSFNGACGYTGAATVSGVIYGEVFPLGTPRFRLFESGENL